MYIYTGFAQEVSWYICTVVLLFTGHYCVSPKLLRKGLRSFELLLFDSALKQIKRRSPKKLLGKRNSNGKDRLI